MCTFISHKFVTQVEIESLQYDCFRLMNDQRIYTGQCKFGRLADFPCLVFDRLIHFLLSLGQLSTFEIGHILRMQMTRKNRSQSIGSKF